MIKQRTNQGERPSIRNFRMLQQFGREEYKQKTEQANQKQNNVNRLEYLKKKYSSKQRSVSVVRTSKQVQIRVPVLQKQQIQNQSVIEDNKQYLKPRQILGNRFSLNQINRTPTTKQNLRLRRLQSQVLDKSLNPSHIQSVNNFQVHQNQPSFTRSTSSYFKSDVQNRDKSRQKVSQRVQNINSINEKIKNLLNRFDATISPPPFNISRESRQLKDIQQSNLKNKKSSFAESQYKPRQSIKCITHEEPKQLAKQQNIEAFSDLNYTKDIKTSKVSIYDAQNIVDQSFVVLKYNPKDKSKQSAQLQNLMYKLSIQIQHDENFRTSKYFILLSKIPNKYERLQHELELKGIKYSLEDLKYLLKFTQQEYNPFIYEQAHQDFNKFCDTIITAQEYWQNNLCKKFNYQKLKQQGIQNIMVFDNKEDQMLISDLVRFVNLGSGNLYKNRDLVLIARRINKNQNNLSPQQILQTFCENTY